MNNIIIDSNIIINVWNSEINPKTGFPLWEGSSTLLQNIRLKKFRGCLSITTIMEIIHRVRITAENANENPDHEIKMALSDINNIGFRRFSPDSLTLTNALSFIADLKLDPFDAILLSIAVNEGMDAVISRDEKLRKKASGMIPVLTPEEFLSA
jgi:predicted nucleic acid-binding protein